MWGLSPASSQVRVLGQFPRELVVSWRPLLLVGLLSWTGTAQVFLQQGQGGVSPAHPGVAGRPALVHSLGHGCQRRRGRVGIQVGRRAEEGVVG